MSEVMTVTSIASRHHQISQIIIDIAAAHFTLIFKLKLKGFLSPQQLLMFDFAYCLSF